MQSLGQEDPLEKGMATHSSILAWRFPWTEKPGGLPSMGSLSPCKVEVLWPALKRCGVSTNSPSLWFREGPHSKLPSIAVII